jgi:hypothetical protein
VFQSTILVLKLLLPPGFAHLKPGVLCLPAVLAIEILLRRETSIAARQIAFWMSTCTPRSIGTGCHKSGR